EDGDSLLASGVPVPVRARIRRFAQPDRSSRVKEKKTNMDGIPDRVPDELLRTTVFTLEAEYRAYRRAAERYHAKAEQGFQMALSLVLETRGEADPVVDSAATTAATAAPLPQHTILTNRETQILKLIAAGNS